MHRPVIVAMLIVAGAMSIPGALSAAPILDTSIPEGPSGVAIFEGESWIQAFTVGAAGLLTYVDVSLAQEEGTAGNLTFRLQTESQFFSLGSLFASTINLNTLPMLSQGFDFVRFYVSGGGIFVTPGDVLGVYLQSDSSPDGPYPYWSASLSFLGATYPWNNIDVAEGHGQLKGDVSLRTYVDADAASPVPEPFTLSLLGSGITGLLFKRARQRTR